jgi:hypothetical protein
MSPKGTEEVGSIPTAPASFLLQGPVSLFGNSSSANPIVMLIMRMLAAASVTDDRINFTRWASPQNNLFGAARGPIRFELVRRCGKWDKQNRTSMSSAPALTRQDLSRKRSSFLLKQKSN